MITATIHMYDRLTKQRKIFIDTYPNDCPIEFLWSEGNYACDCNRWIFMYKDDPNAPEQYNCGSENIVVERIVNHQTNEEIYSGDECDTIR